MDLIRQAMDKYSGAGRAKWTNRSSCRKKLPKGEAYLETEAPKGQMGFMVIGDGTAVPWRVRRAQQQFLQPFGDVGAVPRRAGGRHSGHRGFAGYWCWGRLIDRNKESAFGFAPCVEELTFEHQIVANVLCDLLILSLSGTGWHTLWPRWCSALLMVVVLCSAAVFIWLERKVSARIQDRLGPTRVGGRFGWLQPPADGIKLLARKTLSQRRPIGRCSASRPT